MCQQLTKIAILNICFCLGDTTSNKFVNCDFKFSKFKCFSCFKLQFFWVSIISTSQNFIFEPKINSKEIFCFHLLQMQNVLKCDTITKFHIFFNYFQAWIFMVIGTLRQFCIHIHSSWINTIGYYDFGPKLYTKTNA